MKSKQLLIIIGVLVVVLGAWLLFRFEYLKIGSMTNVEMLKTKTSLIVSEEDVEYFPGARGYFVRPKEEGIYPGLVVIHENRGLRPEIKQAADLLAEEGYAVIAVDLFGRVVETQADAQLLTANFKQNIGLQNMQAAIAYLKDRKINKIGSIGWCFGGGQSLQLALSGEPMDATVIYYGTPLIIDSAELTKIKWPVLGIFGAIDQVVPVTRVNQFKEVLDSLNIKNEIYIYPGVGHAFANPSGMNYAPEETKDAWAKTITFLNRNLK